MAERARDDAVHTPVHSVPALISGSPHSTHRASSPEHGGGARLSIEHTLPLIIGALLLFVILVLSSAVYVEMRRTALETSSARLANVANQFRDGFQASSAQFRALSARTANADVIRAYAANRAPALHDSARAALAYKGAQPEQTVRSELRDSTGALLLSTAASAVLDTITVDDIIAGLRGNDSVITGKYRVVRDTALYLAAARVPATGGAFIVHWRKQVSNPRTRAALSKLIGSNALLLAGNADFSVWTDFDRMVVLPATARSTNGAAQVYSDADGVRHLLHVAPIPGTPWAVALSMPLDTVFAPVTSFLQRIALISLLALLIGLAAAWAVSRRITAPLVELTRAADEIAHGRVTRQITLRRSDELGRLARAFGTMAGEVEHARTALELKVDERTRDLNATMLQLQDTQESLVRREKLAMLGQLASGVGHELRNPLGVMTNAVYYLKMVLSASPKNVHEYLDILQQQITLSEKIVSDLLDFARLRPPQRERASLLQLTETQIARLGPTASAEIIVDIPQDVPQVTVDPVQIGQIILNLLTNAIQALEGPGRITVHAETGNGMVYYDVTDTGGGIQPENVDKIFEPLFTTKARGIGLGLAVSRTLARSNDGDLTATSTPGEGATFRLTLPAAEKPT
ncbi:MAG: ATP-binding protein [Gemmatimonadota bacterium]